MTDDRVALVELLQKSGESDSLRAVAEAVLQILMEADVEGLIGAGRHERSGDRLNYRNGYRDRNLETRLGTLSLRIPKAAPGLVLPTLSGAPKNRREGVGRSDPGGSCPRGWCRSGGFALSGGFGRFRQAAAAGSLTKGSSLNGAMVSSVM